MTRKTYIKKIRALIVAIQQHPESFFPQSYKPGEGMKYTVRYAINVPSNFGSYEAAWNDKTMVWARQHYLGENI